MYPTLDEILQASDVEALLEAELDVQEALLTAGISAVEAVCRQSFEPDGTELAPVTYPVDGSGADSLYLPKRLAVLTGLSLDGAVYQLADFDLHPHGDRLTFKSPVTGVGSWATRVWRDRLDPGPQFGRGRANVAVSGAWGWPDGELPSEVATAIRFDMEDQASANANKLASTVRSARALGLSSIQQGGLSINLGDHEPVISARARRLLERPADPPLIWRGLAGVVV